MCSSIAILRSLSLVLCRASIFTLLCSTVALIIDGLTYLNFVAGTFAALSCAGGAGDEGCVRGMECYLAGAYSPLTSCVFLTSVSL